MKANQGKATQGKATQVKTTHGKTTQREATKEKATQGKATQVKATQGKATQRKTAKVKTTEVNANVGRNHEAFPPERPFTKNVATWPQISPIFMDFRGPKPWFLMQPDLVGAFICFC